MITAVLDPVGTAACTQHGHDHTIRRVKIGSPKYGDVQQGEIRDTPDTALPHT